METRNCIGSNKIALTQNYGIDPTVAVVFKEGDEIVERSLKATLVDRSGQNSRRTAGAIFRWAVADGIYHCVEQYRYSKTNDYYVMFINNEKRILTDHDQLLDALINGADFLEHEVV